MSRITSSFARLLERFIQTESASSIVLISCSVVAMVFANSALSQVYFQALEFKFANLTLLHWINDGLMAIFFFVIGLEIKRELVAGELSSIQKAALPVAAALGGMVAPALIYLFFNPDGAASKGWAIPMATDIAFALGVLTLLGKRVPLSLKIFLLALAIVDDLGAILVIALFYTEEIRMVGIYSGLGALSLIFVARAFSIKSYFIYLPLALALWISVLYSGVHATIAGVILGLITPHTFPVERGSLLSFSPVNDLIHKIHPWVSFGIMPTFALANAGISLSGMSMSSIFESSVSLGTGLGLLIGKPVRIALASGVAVFSGIAALPSDLKWRHILGVSGLAGIGFTMAIFISNLSLQDEHVAKAKIAVLAASVVSALVGGFLLLLLLKRERGGLYAEHISR